MKRKAREWLCSEPLLLPDGQVKPESDDDGFGVRAKQLIAAEAAAEIAVETSDREMSDGEELSVWVWQPGGVSCAKEYFVRVSVSWHFSARLNHD